MNTRLIVSISLFTLLACVGWGCRTAPGKSDERPAGRTIVISRQGAIVHAGPDTRTEYVAVLPYHSEVEILVVPQGSADPSWLRIRQGSKSGWVQRKRVRWISAEIPKPVNEPVVEPGKEPVKEPATEPGKEPVVEPGKEPGKEPVAEPGKEPGKEPVVEPGKEPGKEPVKEPIQEPQLSWGELFKRLRIDSRLRLVNERSTRAIGHLVKPGDQERWRIETIRRTCGGGKGDPRPSLSATDLSFQLEYHWCSVDPGDLVETRCINCEMLKYQCSLSEAEVREARRSGGEYLYRGPIGCRLLEKNFCEKDCLR